MNNLLTDIDLAPKEGFRGFGPLGLEGQESFMSDVNFAKFISTAIGVISIVGILWFVFILMLGAIGTMTAGSDKQALENSRKRILNGLIGLVVLVAGLFIMRLVGLILGIENILNPVYLIDIITK